jgi:hypothetical protein
MYRRSHMRSGNGRLSTGSHPAGMLGRSKSWKE